MRRIDGWTGGIAALLVLLLATAQSPSPSPSPTELPPAHCARPNVPAAVISRASPEIPQLAQQQGISGRVSVIVSLDAASRVVGARIYSSPSAVLNQAAIAAARASRYQTEIRDCRPIPTDYAYTVEFDAPLPSPTLVTGKPAIIVAAAASVNAVPDVVYVTTVVREMSTTVPETQTPRAAVDALRVKLRTLGITSEEITETTQMLRAAPPATSPTEHVLRIELPASRDLAPVLAAVRATPGSTSPFYQYDLRNRETAYHEALARAVRDARTRAEAAAAAAGVRLGALQQLSTDPSDSDFGPSSLTLPGGSTAGQPPTIAIRARVTATYLILQ